MSLPFGLQLSLFFGPGIPMPASPRIAAALEELQIIDGETETGRAGFQLSLRLPQSAPDQVLDYALINDSTLQPQSRIAVTAIVGGVPQGLLNGVILEAELHTNSAGARLILRGEDLLVLADLEDRDKTFPGFPPGMIAAQVLTPYQRFGLTPPVPFPDAPPIPLFEVRTQTETDYAFLQRLASECGYEFFAEPTAIPGISQSFFQPRVRLPPLQPSLTLNFMSHTTTSGIQFRLGPTKGFSTRLSSSNSLPNATPGMPKGLPLARNPTAPLRSKLLRKTVGGTPTAQLKRQQADEAGNPDALQASASINVAVLGSVLKPRRLIGVQGAGDSHSGIFQVLSVTSRVIPSLGLFSQDVRFSRNGRGSTTPVLPR